MLLCRVNRDQLRDVAADRCTNLYAPCVNAQSTQD